MNRWLFVFVALVFIASNLVFAVSLQWVPALIVSFAVATSAVLVCQRDSQTKALFLDAPINLRLLAVCLALATALLLLGGETHLFYANLDWLIRDAVLGDLTARTAPIHYLYHGVEYFLRAPLGMYLLPATAGKVFGLSAAHLVLLAQNALLCSIILYVVGSLSGGWRLVILMIAFSGADIVPTLLDHFLRPDSGGIPDDLELWNGQIQYSSHVTQLFWVPNHALPGWFFATLCLLALRGEIDLAILGVFFASALIWSPLAVLSGLVYLPFFAWNARARLFSSKRLWFGALAGAAFFPVAYYLTIDAGSVPHGLTSLGAPLYLAFIAIEIPHAFFLIWLWRRVPPTVRGLLIASIAILLLLPFFSFGPYNDLVMRGSIAPLFVLSFVFADVALRLSPDDKWPKKAVFWIVALGAFTPGLEFRRALTHPSFAISSCDLLTAAHQLDASGAPANYIARVDAAPASLMRAAPDPAFSIIAK
ncbi:MAG: hypothetical protein WAK03_00720, partial [Methylocystis sp.]